MGGMGIEWEWNLLVAVEWTRLGFSRRSDTRRCNNQSNLMAARTCLPLGADRQGELVSIVISMTMLLLF